jgi:hypothetical protein
MERIHIETRLANEKSTNQATLIGQTQGSVHGAASEEFELCRRAFTKSTSAACRRKAPRCTSKRFRHTRDAKPPTLELKYPVPEYNPTSERLPQLLIDKRMPDPVLKATSLGLPARRAGVVSW